MPYYFPNLRAAVSKRLESFSDFKKMISDYEFQIVEEGIPIRVKKGVPSLRTLENATSPTLGVSERMAKIIALKLKYFRYDNRERMYKPIK